MANEFVRYDPAAELPTPQDFDKATAAEAKALHRYTKLHVARQSPLDFLLITKPETAIDFPHSRLISDHIVALVEDRLYPTGPCPHSALVDGEGVFRHPFPILGCHVPPGTPSLDGLGLTAPPRHGKSYIVSEATPAWYLTRYPRDHVLLATYEAEFAAEWGLKAQYGFLRLAADLGLKLSKRQQARDNWAIDEFDGSMKTAGAGGPLSGKGGQLMIGDDLIKNDEEARSDTIRENRWTWLVSTFFTRGEPVIEGGIAVRRPKKIIMHTRWHDDDPIGRLKLLLADQWFFLDLPAIALEDDPLGRAPGEALCPPRYPISALRQIQRADAFWFEAMYQGNPTREGAGLFTRAGFRLWRPVGGPWEDGGASLRDAIYLFLPDGGYYPVPLRELKSFVTVDLAATIKTSSDWTVFVQWAVTPNLPPLGRPSLLAVRMFRERLESPDHMRALANFVRTGYPNLPITYVGIESKTFGLSLIQEYRRQRELPALRELDADTDKVTRAIPAGQIQKDGRLYLPTEAPWRETFVAEHVVFDKGAHDDIVDNTAYAARLVSMYHDHRTVMDADGRTALPGGMHASRSIEERYARHLKRKMKKALDKGNRL